MSRELPAVETVSELRYGRDPYLDAWLLHFLYENNLDYLLTPLYNVAPEQLRFMVVLDEDQVFVPCSDELFAELIHSGTSEYLTRGYLTAWRVFASLVHQHIKDKYARRKIVTFAKHHFQQASEHHILIPSRLTKRLSGIFLTQSGIDDPFRDLKIRYNERVARFMESNALDNALHHCPDEAMACRRIGDLRWELDRIEMLRLFALSSWADLWHNGPLPNSEAIIGGLAQAWGDAKNQENLAQALGPGQQSKKILYIPNSSGGILFDVLVIQALLRQGHQVMLALKNGFYFQTPTLWDIECDPRLAQALEPAHVMPENSISKNELLRALREHRFLVITDGTRERLNLYRVSVTFSRAWKEADLIIGKGDPQVRRLIDTGHQFTRDILCFHRDEDGQFRLHFKPKPAEIRKFTESDLNDMADSIIQSMREAKQAGKQVMFYSAIIGSIPGQTKTAIEVVQTFVDYLRSRLEGAYIINPAEHFEHGMDGDDLMYMWERVQRSGLIDVWRFQSVADVEKSFELMDRKVPPVWTGKDATFSTGCTKEMKIALETQRRHPELQIIGPNPERFFRRREYGVGKYFDAGIEYL